MSFSNKHAQSHTHTHFLLFIRIKKYFFILKKKHLPAYVFVVKIVILTFLAPFKDKNSNCKSTFYIRITIIIITLYLKKIIFYLKVLYFYLNRDM